jgi:hypothetical protein
LYCIREDGTVFVVRADGVFEVLAEIALGERMIASPVPTANRLLLRGEKNLLCVGTQSASPHVVRREGESSDILEEMERKSSSAMRNRSMTTPRGRGNIRRITASISLR